MFLSQVLARHCAKIYWMCWMLHLFPIFLFCFVFSRTPHKHCGQSCHTISTVTVSSLLRQDGWNGFASEPDALLPLPSDKKCPPRVFHGYQAPLMMLNLDRAWARRAAEAWEGSRRPASTQCSSWRGHISIQKTSWLSCMLLFLTACLQRVDLLWNGQKLLPTVKGKHSLLACVGVTCLPDFWSVSLIHLWLQISKIMLLYVYFMCIPQVSRRKS